MVIDYTVCKLIGKSVALIQNVSDILGQFLQCYIIWLKASLVQCFKIKKNKKTLWNSKIAIL